jgi:hypothetical protein
MKKLSIRKQADLPSITEIEAFEKEFNISLPHDYRIFILTYNAIDLKECIFNKGNEKYYIDVFYPLSETYELSLQFMFQNLKEYFRNDFLPFANDSGGWQFVLSLKSDDYGKVYFCRMDDSPPFSLTLLSGSFYEFVDKLQRD